MPHKCQFIEKLLIDLHWWACWGSQPYSGLKCAWVELQKIHLFKCVGPISNGATRHLRCKRWDENRSARATECFEQIKRTSSFVWMGGQHVILSVRIYKFVWEGAEGGGVRILWSPMGIKIRNVSQFQRNLSHLFHKLEEKRKIVDKRGKLAWNVCRPLAPS